MRRPAPHSRHDQCISGIRSSGIANKQHQSSVELATDRMPQCDMTTSTMLTFLRLKLRCRQLSPAAHSSFAVRGSFSLALMRSCSTVAGQVDVLYDHSRALLVAVDTSNALSYETNYVSPTTTITSIIYTVSQKNCAFIHNFDKYWSIFSIFSLFYSPKIATKPVSYSHHNLR